jgi:hypothetical protein
MLNSGPAANAAPAASEWVMHIQGPNGVEQWDWATRATLPTKSSIFSPEGGAIAPAPGAAPNTNLAPPTAPEPTTKSTEETIPGDSPSSDLTLPGE